MAFPVVQTADTKNGTVAVNSTSWTLTWPTNIAAGDLILAFVSADGATGNWNAAGNGFTLLEAQGGVANVLTVGAKIADGTETGTFSAAIAASESGGWRIFRITGWFGSGLSTEVGGGNNGAGVVADGVTATTANPNPPALNPNAWNIEDTLWIAAVGIDTSRTISVYPLPDLNTADISGGAGGATLGICMTNSAAASLDPGTFTISASDDTGTVTIGVRPAAAAVRVPPQRTFQPFLAQ
jgi:hypothetical protein